MDYKPRFFRYSDSGYEAYKDGRGATIYDRKQNSYFFIKNTSSLPDWQWEPICIKMGYIAPSIMASIILISALYAIWMFDNEKNIISQYRYIPTVLVILVIYGTVQAIIHELAHAYALSRFGYNVDKFGFRFEYRILPTFYVRVNKVLLLPPTRRIVVHLAGVFINSIVNTILLIQAQFINANPYFTTVLCIYSFSIVFNSLPLLNTDGYRAFLCILGINETISETPVSIKIVYTISISFIVTYLGYMIYTIERMI